MRSKFFEILKFVFLSDVAHKSFWVKFSGLISKLKIFEKSYWSPQIFNAQTYIWSLFKAKKIMVRQWSLPNYFASKTQKISLCYNLSWQHAIKNSSEQMQQMSRWMEMIHQTIGWRRDEHGTHEHAHGSWILWSLSRVRSKTKHSLPCITSCYIDSRFFLHLEQSHTALLGCRLAASRLRETVRWQ